MWNPGDAAALGVPRGLPAPAEGGKGFQPDEPRMVYVGNLPWNLRWQDLKDHMRTAGEVEFSKILTYDGSDWGRSRGIAYVRFSTEAEAKAAVATLNKTELSGRTITVDAWTGSKPKVGGGKGMFWGFGGKGFMGKGYWFGGGKGGGKSMRVFGDTTQMVYVGNLPYKMEWQEVKDVMKSAGTVEFVKIMTQDGSNYTSSKGSACVRFSSAEEANTAIATLNGTELQGRKLVVDAWSRGALPPS